MFDGGLWDFLIWMFWFYIFFACIWLFITVIVDLFRDHTLNGWGKALWVIFLVVAPFLGVLVYFIARGQGMAQRELERRAQAQTAANSYIRDVAGASSPAAEIESAKKLARLRCDHAGRVRRPEGEGARRLSQSQNPKTGSRWRSRVTVIPSFVAYDGAPSRARQRAHPIVPRIVLQFHETERFEQRRHVHSEASPIAVPLSVPAAHGVRV